jgi:hypothetical protein
VNNEKIAIDAMLDRMTRQPFAVLIYTPTWIICGHISAITPRQAGGHGWHSVDISWVGPKAGKLWDLPTFLSDGYRGSFPGVKRPRREVDHSTPPVALAKNVRSYASIPPIGFHGVERENVTFPVRRNALNADHVPSFLSNLLPPSNLQVTTGATFLHVTERYLNVYDTCLLEAKCYFSIV